MILLFRDLQGALFHSPLELKIEVLLLRAGREEWYNLFVLRLW